MAEEPTARYAEVIVDVAAAGTDRIFHYRIPAGMDLLPGSRVLVPLGPRRTTGFVVGLTGATDVPPERMRSIIRPLDEEPLLPPELIELSRWVAGTYACRLVHALRAALPPLVRRAAPAARRMLAVVPAVDRAQLQRAAEALAARAPRQAEALRRLLDALDRAGEPPWLRDLTRGTALAAQHYRALAQRGLVQVVERVHARDPYPVDAPAAGSLHPPTPDQEGVLAAGGEALTAG
ncbi:MAG TPA: primosomal protein N', partial [Bacillota bacterium]